MRKQLTCVLLLILAAVLSACGRSAVETPVSEPAPVEQATVVSELARPTPTTPAIITLEPEDEPYPPPVAAQPSGAYPSAPQPAAPASSAYPGVGTSGNTRLFVIESAESEAAYMVEEEFFSGAVQQLGQALGLTNTVGRTNEIEGEFELDLTAVDPLVSGQFTVDLRALTSNESRRDSRIRSEWLESDRYPIAEFVATSIENFPANYVEGQTATFDLLGEMTIRDVTQPVRFEVTAVLANNSITGTGRADMRMTDFGFNPPSLANLFTVSNDFSVEITFTAHEAN